MHAHFCKFRVDLHRQSVLIDQKFSHRRSVGSLLRVRCWLGYGGTLMGELVKEKSWDLLYCRHYYYFQNLSPLPSRPTTNKKKTTFSPIYFPPGRWWKEGGEGGGAGQGGAGRGGGEGGRCPHISGQKIGRAQKG